MSARSTIPAPRATRRRPGRIAAAVLGLALLVPGVANAQVLADPAPPARTADRPTDRAVDRPVDRATDRPGDRVTDRRRRDVRVETFEVGDVGAVTLAWNATHVRVVRVRTAPDWRSHVRQASGRAVRVGFTNGRACAVFVAGLREDGLHTAARRVDCHPDRVTDRARPGDRATDARAVDRPRA